MKSRNRFGKHSEESSEKSREQDAFHSKRIIQEGKFEAKHMSSNTPQGNDEYEQRVAEEANFNTRKMIAEAAFYMAERRGFMPGQEDSDWLKAEIDIEDFLRGAQRTPLNPSRAAAGQEAIST